MAMTTDRPTEDRVDTDRYTIISADCHAGGSHEMYREYLDPAYVDDFDAWREKYRNPFRDLQEADGGRVRNWDDERRICGPRGRRHRRRGRLPQHRAAVLPELRALRPAADAPISSSTAWPASGPTTAGWPTGASRFPERRAGIGQIFLNDVDEAIARRALDQGERAARRHPDLGGPARLRRTSSRSTTRSTTRCGRCARSSRCRSTPTAAPACPTTAATPPRRCCSSTRSPSTRSVRSCSCWSPGVFERFPRLKFVMTEMGCAWLPADARAPRPDPRADPRHRPGGRAALRARARAAAAARPSTSGATAGSAPASPARTTPRRATRSASTGSCGAATTPTTRAPGPTPVRRSASASPTRRADEMRRILAGQRGRALRLRPGRAGADRAAGRADGRGDRRAAHRAARRPRRSPPALTRPEAPTSRIWRRTGRMPTDPSPDGTRHPRKSASGDELVGCIDRSVARWLDHPSSARPTGG